MSERGITIVLRAKNAMQRGLGAAGKALRGFGKSALRIGKRMAVGMLAAGAAIAGVAARALQAWGKQESAERSLIAARRAAGDAMADNIDAHKAMAAAIQDATGVADEQTLATMAQLRTLGVLDDKLGQAAKGMIALTAAGMGEATAQRAMAAAMAGNFEMLTRYIPALRDAADEGEKMAIVNDFLNRGYQAQQERLNTVSGAWDAFKGRVGDAWEEVGKLIAQDSQLTGMLHRAGEAVQEFSKRMQRWAGEGGVDRLVLGVRKFGAEAMLVYDKLVAYIAYAMSESYESVMWFGQATAQVMRNAAAITENIWRNTTETIGHWLAKMHAKATRQEWNIAPPDLREFLDGVEDIPKKTGAAANQLFADIEAMNVRHAARMGDIDSGRAKVVESVAKREIEANESIIDSSAMVASQKRKLAEEEERIAKDLEKAKQRAAQETLREQERIAADTVRSYINRIRQERRAEAQWERDKARAARLERRTDQGARDFVRAVADISAAREQVDEARRSERTQEDILAELRKIHKDQMELLAAG